MPLGLQMTARPGDDGLLLDFAVAASHYIASSIFLLSWKYERGRKPKNTEHVAVSTPICSGHGN
jgi:hypothetical protein